jgi:hypothetical protein
MAELAQARITASAAAEYPVDGGCKHQESGMPWVRAKLLAKERPARDLQHFWRGPGLQSAPWDVSSHEGSGIGRQRVMAQVEADPTGSRTGLRTQQQFHTLLSWVRG